MTARHQPPREPDERLADWVDGRLDAEELARFEAELEVDAELRAVAEGYRNFVEMVRAGLADEAADGSDDGEPELGGPDFDRASTDALLDRLAREGLVAADARVAAAAAPVAAAAAADLAATRLRRISLDAAADEAHAAGASGGGASAGAPRLAMWWSIAAAAVLLAAFGLAHWMAPDEPAPEVNDATAVLEHLGDGAAPVDAWTPSGGVSPDQDESPGAELRRMARGGAARSRGGADDAAPTEKALDRTAVSADLELAADPAQATDPQRAQVRGRPLADDPAADASPSRGAAEELSEVAAGAVDRASNEAGSAAPPVPGGRGLAKSEARAGAGADVEAEEAEQLEEARDADAGEGAGWEGGLGTGGGKGRLFAALSEPVYVLELDSDAAGRLGLDVRGPDERQAASPAGAPARVGAVTRDPGLAGGAGGPIPPAGPGAADGPKAGGGGVPGRPATEPRPSGPSTPGPSSPGPTRRAAPEAVVPETAVTGTADRPGLGAESLLRFRGGLIPGAEVGSEEDALRFAELLKATGEALEIDRESSNQLGAELVPADARALETRGLLSFLQAPAAREPVAPDRSEVDETRDDTFFARSRPGVPEVYAYRQGDVAYRIEGDLPEIARSLQILRERFLAAGATLVEQQVPQLRERELLRELDAVATGPADADDAKDRPDDAEALAGREQDLPESERVESARTAPLGQTGAVTHWGFLDVLRKRAASETDAGGALQGVWVVLRLPTPAGRPEEPAASADDQPSVEPAAGGAGSEREKR